MKLILEEILLATFRDGCGAQTGETWCADVDLSAKFKQFRKRNDNELRSWGSIFSFHLNLMGYCDTSRSTWYPLQLILKQLDRNEYIQFSWSTPTGLNQSLAFLNVLSFGELCTQSELPSQPYMGLVCILTLGIPPANFSAPVENYTFLCFHTVCW